MGYPDLKRNAKAKSGILFSGSGNESCAELRQLWQEVLHDQAPGVAADAVLDRLERKYQAMTDAVGTAK